MIRRDSTLSSQTLDSIKPAVFAKAMHVSKLILSKRLIRGGGNEEIVQKTTIGRTKHSNICSRCSGASASSVTKQSWARSWAMHEYDCVQQLRQSTAGGKSLRKLFVDLIEIFLSKTLMVFIWIVCKTNVRLRSLKPAEKNWAKLYNTAPQKILTAYSQSKAVVKYFRNFQYKKIGHCFDKVCNCASFHKYVSKSFQ